MIGQTIAGRYRLTEQIGEGATGTVYRAEVVGGGEPVAIKVLRVDPGARDKERRFEREAMAGAQAEHPNCVAVRDYGALEDGRPYLVMELVQGRTLAALLAEEKQLEPDRALRILAHLLRGLGHAHGAGVVHRDLKPDDIVLVEQGGDREHAKILDFGTAALIGAAGASSEPLTRAGITLGTPAYMAPERLGGGPVDGRADLYSASCILFEMLAGRPPFTADDPQELLRAHLTAPIPQLSEAAPEVPPDPALEAILVRGLGKDPGHRFASAEEYLAAVEARLEGRFDPVTMGKPQAGRLAAPDPNKATTVFHGAPQRIQQAAAEMAAAAAAGAAAQNAAGTPAQPGPPSLPPPSPSMPAPIAPSAAPPAAQVPPTGAPLPPAATPLPAPGVPVGAIDPPTGAPHAPGGPGASPGRAQAAGSNRTLFFAGVAAAIGLVIVAVLASRGCRDEGGGGGADGDHPVVALEDGWERAGLAPGGFAEIDGEELGGGDCRAGAVSGLDVTVCSYPDEASAAEARKAGLALVGSATGAALVDGARLLVVADPKKADPSGRAIDKVIKVFQGRPLERPRPKETGGSK